MSANTSSHVNPAMNPTTLNSPTVTTPRTALNPRIILRYTGWELWRNLRMVDSTFFIIVLPVAMYLMFGVGMNEGSLRSGYGNVAAYIMTSMAVYGAVIATTAMAGSAAVERSYGWGRQLSMTSLTDAGYLLGKMLASVAMAVIPIVTVFVAGLVTGAELDGIGRWFAVGGLCLLVALPFAFYGLGIALIFRSETAVSAASGILVIFAFFGNLFVPLSGVMLDIARFTPLYGVATLARWPQTEGFVIPIEGVGPDYVPEFESLGPVIANIVVWTLIFVTVCVLASRRRTQR